MPIFDYHCASCGATFECLVHASGRSTVRCPECDSPKVKKQFSLFSSPSSGCKDSGKSTFK